MIRLKGLTIPVIVPQGADLTADDDDFKIELLKMRFITGMVGVMM
jgi:hypothetical protein